jgi:CHAD domain-containing protein
MPHKILKDAVTQRWQKFQKELVKCRKNPGTETVHDLRVSIRRFNAALDTLYFLQTWELIPKVKKELKSLMRLLGKLRDVHVQGEWLNDLFSPADCAGINQYLKQLINKEKRLAKTIKTRVLLFKPKVSSQFARQISKRSNRDMPIVELCAGIKSYLSGRHQEITKWEAAASIPANVQGAHKLRIALKCYRYACEVCLPLLRKTASTNVILLQTLQSLLGQIHDMDVLQDKLDAFSRKPRRSTWEKTDLVRALEKLDSKRADLHAQFIAQYSAQKSQIEPQHLLLSISTFRRKAKIIDSPRQSQSVVKEKAGA